MKWISIWDDCENSREKNDEKIQSTQLWSCKEHTLTKNGYFCRLSFTTILAAQWRNITKGQKNTAYGNTNCFRTIFK